MLILNSEILNSQNFTHIPVYDAVTSLFYYEGHSKNQTKYFDYAEPFVNGLACVSIAGKWGFIDTSQEFVIAPLFNEARSFSGNYAVVILDFGESNVIKTDGSLVFNENYDLIKNLSSNFFLVSKNGNLTIVDTFGNQIIKDYSQLQIEDAKPFNNDYAWIKEHGSWKLINKKGQQFIFPFVADIISDFVNNKYLVYSKESNTYYEVEIENKITFKSVKLKTEQIPENLGITNEYFVIQTENKVLIANHKKIISEISAEDFKTNQKNLLAINQFGSWRIYNIQTGEFCKESFDYVEFNITGLVKTFKGKNYSFREEFTFFNSK
jgi:hypothetical protein